mmetsp:Transcript_14035/g.40049  ORF Transcript_14035/g.40049 Transcript_14035/m.40049 type:complete len:415 (+) Transcript_14035:76-1320(+)
MKACTTTAGFLAAALVFRGAAGLSIGGVAVASGAGEVDAAAAAERVQSLGLLDQRLDAHQGDVRALSFVPGGDRIVSGGEDSLVKQWAAADLSINLPSQPVTHTVYDLDVALDGTIAATGEGGWNGNANADTLRIWTANLSLLLNATQAPVGYIYSVAVSPNAQRVAVSGFYGDIVIYNYDHSTRALDIETIIETGQRRTNSLAFSPDGEFLASTSQAGMIQLRQTQGFNLVGSLPHSGKWDFPIDFSPDGSLLASGTDYGLLKIWDVETLQELVSVNAGIGGIYCVSFSADGAKVAAGGDATLRVFDVATGDVLAEAAQAHAGRVLDVDFQPVVGSSNVTSGGRDGAIKLWSLGAGGTTTPPLANCLGLVDSKGTAFCQKKLSWCPVNGGSTVQCDYSCCCEEFPTATGCPVP